MRRSFDPDTKLFYVSARRLWSIFYMTAEGKPEGWAGRDRKLWAIRCWRRSNRWQHELGEGEGSAGILTTAGNLLFTADNADNAMALNPATGKTLWHVNLGARMQTGPDNL